MRTADSLSEKGGSIPHTGHGGGQGSRAQEPVQKGILSWLPPPMSTGTESRLAADPHCPTLPGVGAGESRQPVKSAETLLGTAVISSPRQDTQPAPSLHLASWGALGLVQYHTSSSIKI